jgi:hypothetical protein
MLGAFARDRFDVGVPKSALVYERKAEAGHKNEALFGKTVAIRVHRLIALLN